MKHQLIVILVLVVVPNAVADPPALKSIYPAGVQRGATATITANGTFKAWPVNVWCDDPSVKIVPLKKRGQMSVTVGKDVLPGVGWIRLHNADGASELRPLIIGALPEVLEKEPNNDPAKPQLLTATAVTINGRLQSSGDVDVFALELKTGQTLVASMQSRRILNAPMDGVLQILSNDGFVLAQNDDYHDMDPQIVFPVPKDGRYLVRAFAFPATPNSSVQFAGGADYIYRLTLTTNAFADHAFPLAVRRENPTPIDLIGWNIPPEFKSINVAAQTDHATVYHPQFANAVAVRLEPHITYVAKKEQKGPQTIQFPSTVSGRIAVPGESDVFQFAVKKGQRLQIDIDSATLGAPLDPVLTLTDADGKLIKQAQTRTIGADPEIIITASKDATYRISVNDLHDRGGMRYVYRLRVAAPAADFALKAAKDRFTVAIGKTLEIPITITRKNGHREPIEIFAENLPKGVVAKPVVADAKAKSIKLRIVGGKQSVGGAIQIVGRTKTLQRSAVAAVADLGTATPHLFFTVKK